MEVVEYKNGDEVKIVAPSDGGTPAPFRLGVVQGRGTHERKKANGDKVPFYVVLSLDKTQKYSAWWDQLRHNVPPTNCICDINQMLWGTHGCICGWIEVERAQARSTEQGKDSNNG